MNRFWNIKDNTLEINGVIAAESWWGDEVTPKVFKDELAQCKGDIKVNINSCGGDVFAAVEIYNALKAHDGKVSVFIDSLAASAASLIMCAGDEVVISQGGCVMIHNPATMAWGDSSEMEKAKNALEEIKESIMNIYVTKTGLSRNLLSEMMDDETWISAYKALSLGFADKVLDDETVQNKGTMFTRNEITKTERAVAQVIINKIKIKDEQQEKYRAYKEKVENLLTQ